MRKFEVIDAYKDKGINLPKRATKYSAGYDIESAVNIDIPAFGVSPQAVLVPTGLRVHIPNDETLLLFNRSSGFKNYNLMLANNVGVIDSDYTGQIFGNFINFGSKPVHLAKGTRIMQGVFVKYQKVNDDYTDALRVSGFGSTN